MPVTLFSLVFGLLLAAEGAASFEITELLTTSVNSVQSQLFTVLNIVVPAIVGVLAAVVCVKFGINWMKKLGSK